MIGSVILVSLISFAFGGGEIDGTPWEKYVQNQTIANARLVKAIEYTTQDEREALENAERDIELLEKQILRSEREAVSLGFRALAHADGHIGEMLSEVLGLLIKVNPSLFLQELKNHRSSVRRLDSLVGDLGDDFVDEEAATRREFAARIKALKSVTDPKHRTVRNECVAELSHYP